MPILGALFQSKVVSAISRAVSVPGRGGSSPSKGTGLSKSSDGVGRLKNSDWIEIDNARVKISGGGSSSQSGGEEPEAVPLKGIRVDQNFALE